MGGFLRDKKIAADDRFSKTQFMPRCGKGELNSESCSAIQRVTGSEKAPAFAPTPLYESRGLILYHVRVGIFVSRSSTRFESKSL
jgi:hypothetical protein